MHSDFAIFGDWGTTSLSLLRYSADGPAPDYGGIKHGKGIKFCPDPESHFHDLVADWLDGRQAVPAYLSGMVGANIGWKEAAYVSCPISLAQFAQSGERFSSRDVDVTIMPGSFCENRFGDPEVMRGEETQVFGALSLSPPEENEERWYCLPGTHTKWVQTKGADISVFLTIPRGEMWDILCNHSILLGGRSGELEDIDWAAFDECLMQVRSGRWPDSMGALFSARAGLVSGKFGIDVATARLSAILIGFDVSTGLQAGSSDPAEVTIIGSDTNAALYERALRKFGKRTTSIASSRAAFAGLTAVYELEKC